MKIAIAGASGFVGTTLTQNFIQKGFEVIQLQRDQIKDIPTLSNLLNGCDVVINLSGANIIHRWSQEYKKILYSSRIDTTKNLIQGINSSQIKPKIFISTSAVGIYDNKGIYSEENFQYSDDFLANLCKDWEEEALKASDLGVRTLIFRFGIVLGSDGGALSQMLTPFKLGVGGTIGDGSQAFSFIHIEDLVNSYLYAIQNSSLEGIYNLTAPIPTTNKELTKALGKVLNRPTFLPLPEFVLNLIFGEGAKVLTDGQSAIPTRLQQSGFEFKYQTIQETLENLLD
jgi:uncharacterized protein